MSLSPRSRRRALVVAALWAAVGLGAAISPRPVLAGEDAQALFERGFYLERGSGKLDEAIAAYRQAVAAAGDADRPLAARAFIRIAACELELGREVEARAILRGLGERYGDLPEVRAAIDDLVGERPPEAIVRVYDVVAIAAPLPEDPALAPLGLPRERTSHPRGSVLLLEDPGARTFLSADRLAALVQRGVLDADGADDDDAVEVVDDGRALAVRATAPVQERVAAYLAQLEAEHGRVLEVEVVAATAEGAELANLAVGALPPEAAAALLGRATWRGRALTRDRAPVAIQSVREVPFTGSVWTNQTGVTPTVQPGQETLLDGRSVRLRPQLLPGGKHALVEVDGILADLESMAQPEDVRAGEQALGEGAADARAGGVGLGSVKIQLPSVRSCGFSVTVVVPLGRWIVLGASDLAPSSPGEKEAHDAPVGAARQVVLARCREVERPGRPAAAAGARGPEPRRPLRYYDLGLLLQGSEREVEPRLRAPSLGLSRDRAAGAPSGGGAALTFDEGPPSTLARFDPDTLVALIQANIDPDSWGHEESAIEVEDGPVLAVVQTAAAHARIEALLGELLAERLRLVTVETLSLSVDAAHAERFAETTVATSTFAAALTGTDAGVEVAGYARVSGLDGDWAGIDGTRERRLLAGYERASGGTGLVVVVAETPVVDTLVTGSQLRARARLLAGRPWAEVEATLDRARADAQPRERGAVWPVWPGPQVTHRPVHATLAVPLDRAAVVERSQAAGGRVQVTLLRVQASAAK